MTKIKNIALTLSAIVLFATGTFAGTTENKALPMPSFTNIDPISVQFLGEKDNYLFFQVIVKAGTAKKAAVEINDRVEGELYAARFGTDKVQTFKIEKRDNQELNFTVSVGNETYSKLFTMMPTVVLNKEK